MDIGYSTKMKFGITGWMILVWSLSNLVDGAPCQAFLTIEECQANNTTSSTTGAKCVWCQEMSTCDEDITQCDSVPINGATNGNETCTSLASQGDCTAITGCVWCNDMALCIFSATNQCDNLVPSKGCNDEDCVQEGGGITINEASEGQQDVCRSLSSEAECSSSLEGCGWCDDAGFCGSQHDACSGRVRLAENNTDNACQNLGTEANCTSVENCLWCIDQGECIQETMSCLGDGGGSDWNNCSAVWNQTECAETGMCFWCAEQDECRPNFGDCSGNDGIIRKPNLCLQLNNETDCADSGSCVWCADSTLCRASEEECPGRGRTNRCQDLINSTCDFYDECLWWPEHNRCGPHRGVPPLRLNSTDDNGYGNTCQLWSDEGNCTMQSICRWCPEDELCQSAFNGCNNGTLGTRGNPCQQAATEDVCTNNSGCLWCNESSKCERATIQSCKRNDGDNATILSEDICIVHDLPIECEQVDECQWCEGQFKCKLNQTDCGDPSGKVDLSFDELDGPKFQIRDDGLGETDPYAVTVLLDFLYEVTEEGQTIDASLVDLQAQVYHVKQSVGFFFGDSIEARKIQFATTIDGVGSIALDAYIILNEGNITTPGTESWAVAAGDVKFNVELSNWTFCGDQAPCGESTLKSAFIDLAFSIRGNSESPQPSNDNALVFNLGGNVPLLLSSEIEVDEFMGDMPDGFPRAESTTKMGTVFIFRFPKFSEGVSYDPIIPYHYSLSVLQGRLKPTDPPIATAPPTTSAPTGTTSPKPTTASPTFIITPLPTPSNTDDDGVLSIEVIAGIAGGSSLVLCCCCVGIGYVIYRMMVAGNHGNHGDRAALSSDQKNSVTLDNNDFDDEIDSRHRRQSNRSRRQNPEVHRHRRNDNGVDRHRRGHDHDEDRHRRRRNHDKDRHRRRRNRDKDRHRRRRDEEEDASSGIDSDEDNHHRGYNSSSSSSSSVEPLFS